MKALRVVLGIVSVFITLPIWFYLLYKILEASHASELMWFLFWIYLPASLLGHVLARIAAED